MPAETAQLFADEEAQTRLKAEPICGRAAALAGEVSHWWDGIGWRRRLNVHLSDVPPERHQLAQHGRQRFPLHPMNEARRRGPTGFEFTTA